MKSIEEIKSIFSKVEIQESFNNEGIIYVDTKSVDYPINRIVTFLKKHDYLKRTIDINKADFIVVDPYDFNEKDYDNLEYLQKLVHDPNKLVNINLLLALIEESYNLTPSFMFKLKQLLATDQSLALSYITAVNIPDNIYKICKFCTANVDQRTHTRILHKKLWKSFIQRVHEYLKVTYYPSFLTCPQLDYSTLTYFLKKGIKIKLTKDEYSTYIDYITDEYNLYVDVVEEKNFLQPADTTPVLSLPDNLIVQEEYTDELRIPELTYELINDVDF